MRRGWQYFSGRLRAFLKRTRLFRWSSFDCRDLYERPDQISPTPIRLGESVAPAVHLTLWKARESPIFRPYPSTILAIVVFHSLYFVYLLSASYHFLRFPCCCRCTHLGPAYRSCVSVIRDKRRVRRSFRARLIHRGKRECYCFYREFHSVIISILRCLSEFSGEMNGEETNGKEWQLSFFFLVAVRFKILFLRELASLAADTSDNASRQILGG